MTVINPLNAFGGRLASIQNPARYLGGEYGQIKKDSGDLVFALAFPDLYEIAMSNLAIKILYDGLNRMTNIRCERVFAPAPDFEALLSSASVPLYTLESGIPLNKTDIIGFSVGYEPGITGVLAILESGGVPLDAADRTEGDPIILAGGCGVTNPAPFARFFDAVFIGEAEAGLFDLIALLAERKKAGGSREDLLSLMESHPAVWSARKSRASGGICARRAVYAGFGSSRTDGPDRQVCFPVPNLRIVQDHGSVEIMRGCPNGCRFCHAGLYYRPQRMKDPERILHDIDYLVTRGGYREISLMSLSSGDYEGIDFLLNTLIERYAGQNISFQLPSLKVNTFTLPILEKLAQVRKSGLTFAVETPVDAWQRSINKDVYRSRIIEIIHEAKKRGWSKAKFYFMVGLPVDESSITEEDAIIDFLLDIQATTRIQCNVNVGTFIPKPHTPYQWERQLSMEESQKKLDHIYRNLPRGKFKVSTHKPFSSFLEAVISRGDERVGELILEAYRRGCRLDAWEDWARPDIWQDVFSGAEWNVESETIRERAEDETLPWDSVSLGPTKTFLKNEREKSRSGTPTAPCEESCATPCGVCNRDVHVKKPPDPVQAATVSTNSVAEASVGRYRVLVSFSKRDAGIFIPHLGLLEIWNKAFARSGLPVVYTEGFNPLPRFELSQSLSLGIASEDETATFILKDKPESPDMLRDILNASLPEILRVNRVYWYELSTKVKRQSLSVFLWGNRYRYEFSDRETLVAIKGHEMVQAYLSENTQMIFDDADGNTSAILTMPFHADRKFRELITEITGKPVFESVTITKMETLATHPVSGELVSFFDVFEYLDGKNRAEETLS